MDNTTALCVAQWDSTPTHLAKHTILSSKTHLMSNIRIRHGWVLIVVMLAVNSQATDGANDCIHPQQQGRWLEKTNNNG